MNTNFPPHTRTVLCFTDFQNSTSGASFGQTQKYDFLKQFVLAQNSKTMGFFYLKAPKGY